MTDISKQSRSASRNPIDRANRKMMSIWMGWGSRVLPFADVATDDLPLSRLLRLSLIQVSVGVSLVLLAGTLNRVMIVELGVPATLVGVMLALPMLFAPFRALIGFQSDAHVSALGWRRVPFILRGTMLQFGGLAMMPFALLVLAGAGQSSSAPAWIGQAAAGLAFLLVGAGLHITQTVGLALATDQAPESAHPNIVGLMYSMLLIGMIVAALLFGAALANFSHGRLIQVIQGTAVITFVLNFAALWKQEARQPNRVIEAQRTFQESWALYAAEPHAIRRLVAVALGTLAFSMEDILLEPYGGQILGLSVGDTTKLTATFAGGGLLGFALASRILSRGFDPFRMAIIGALIGIPAFAMVIAAAPLHVAWLFVVGVGLIGFGGGLFGHGTLTATMNFAPKEQIGLALGSWGAAQATAAGVGAALGGFLRDVGQPAGLALPWQPAATGYIIVYTIEIVLLIATLAAMVPLLRARPTSR
ncbi:MFS transporter [Sphingomonas sp.]|uniref:MFS transporter n=1 Tax=Sphingomonas sp. TaxID=28214 RepID=UPI0025D33347|nr:MFS transporter [Sphingomonas sp.]